MSVCVMSVACEGVRAQVYEFSGAAPYLLGHSPSLADIVVYCWLRTIRAGLIRPGHAPYTAMRVVRDAAWHATHAARATAEALQHCLVGRWSAFVHQCAVLFHRHSQPCLPPRPRLQNKPTNPPTGTGPHVCYVVSALGAAACR